MDKHASNVTDVSPTHDIIYLHAMSTTSSNISVVLSTHLSKYI